MFNRDQVFQTLGSMMEDATVTADSLSVVWNLFKKTQQSYTLSSIEMNKVCMLKRSKVFRSSKCRMGLLLA